MGWILRSVALRNASYRVETRSINIQTARWRLFTARRKEHYRDNSYREECRSVIISYIRVEIVKFQVRK